MKKFALISIFLLIFKGIALTQIIPQDSLYQGQTPPGNIPVIFNLPVNSGLRPIERIAISSDGKEIYYGVLNTYPPSIPPLPRDCIAWFNIPSPSSLIFTDIFLDTNFFLYL
jgi:hypothetical protein